VLLAGCSVGEDTAPTVEGPAAKPAGPLDGLRWPAGTLRANTLLSDDGRVLREVRMDGRSRVVWRHPRVDVGAIAAAPDGRGLAYALYGKSGVTGFLYLLGQDGSVRLVDTARGGGAIQSPTFLRPYGRAGGSVRLTWVRTATGLDDATGSRRSEVRALVGGQVRRIRTVLRGNEAPHAITGYPGTHWPVLTLVRTDNLPTRFELVRPIGFPRPLALVEFGSILNTDSPTGVAWVSPVEYVVADVHRAFPARYSLRLFRVGCEYAGSHVAYRGAGIDLGYGETPWNLVPGGPRTVLALGARDLASIRAGRARSARWLAVDVVTGAMRKTRIEWKPGEWWAAVEPARHGGRSGVGCDRYTLTFP
jgi:hypothetical protein